MELCKIRLGDLRLFAESDLFQRLPVKPVSWSRVESYLANPHAQADDPVLYFIADENRMISFRTVLPAILNTDNSRFVWLSGAWTQLDYRKQGLSSQLLHEIHLDWNGRLMATNFSPDSRKLYEKSGLLKPFYQAKGRRFFLFAESQQLLQRRIGNLIFLWPVLDFFMRFWANQKLRNFKIQQATDIRMEKMAFPDRECMQLANDRQKEYLFRRGEAELKWILAYPWLSTDDRTFEQSYPFSSFASQFEVYTVKFYRGTKFLGFLIYSIRNGHLKLLYHHFCEISDEHIAGFFIEEAISKRVKMLTILQPQLANKLKTMTHPFLGSTELSHQIFTSFDGVPRNMKIQDSEGDFIWT
ncbi:GNAT family N-acetyltransferase [Mangrovibacterium sp.]|uniref:GNAT family N-acetyltransferase n=1 Tax=Mangrovibacterium sp. TaxID=1961364 RepID=UPI003568C179